MLQRTVPMVPRTLAARGISPCGAIARVFVPYPGRKPRLYGWYHGATDFQVIMDISLTRLGDVRLNGSVLEGRLSILNRLGEHLPMH